MEPRVHFLLVFALFKGIKFFQHSTTADAFEFGEITCKFKSHAVLLMLSGTLYENNTVLKQIYT